ncbi:hypothetical protein P355_3649 [Burkholderia cenocepacia KC-01]|nr:hypothetical protein P355_3649 [Burkholderia cenocepacia KC-01]
MKNGSCDPSLCERPGAPGPDSTAALPRRRSKCFPARLILGERSGSRCNRAVACVTVGKTNRWARAQAGSAYLMRVRRRQFLRARGACNA